MPRRDDWQSRIKAVEREFLAVRLGTDRLQEASRRDPTLLRGQVDPRDLARASDALEGTYLVRMFAEFETGLRLYWDSLRDTNPRTVDLLNSLAGQRGIPDDQRDNAHLVREYRNSLVHEREDADGPHPDRHRPRPSVSLLQFPPPEVVTVERREQKPTASLETCRHRGQSGWGRPTPRARRAARWSRTSG
jgi:hypothetical protein